MEAAAWLKQCDAFPKTRDEAREFFQRTSAGGAITIVSACFMALLFLSELRGSLARSLACSPAPLPLVFLNSGAAAVVSAVRPCWPVSSREPPPPPRAALQAS